VDTHPSEAGRGQGRAWTRTLRRAGVDKAERGQAERGHAPFGGQVWTGGRAWTRTLRRAHRRAGVDRQAWTRTHRRDRTWTRTGAIRDAESGRVWKSGLNRPRRSHARAVPDDAQALPVTPCSSSWRAAHVRIRFAIIPLAPPTRSAADAFENRRACGAGNAEGTARWAGPRFSTLALRGGWSRSTHLARSRVELTSGWEPASRDGLRDLMGDARGLEMGAPRLPITRGRRRRGRSDTTAKKLRLPGDLAGGFGSTIRPIALALALALALRGRGRGRGRAGGNAARLFVEVQSHPIHPTPPTRTD